MNLLDWFDEDNIEHLKAYKHLMKTGLWPKDFIPEGITFPTNWCMMLNSKFASKYVELKIRGKDASKRL